LTAFKAVFFCPEIADGVEDPVHRLSRSLLAYLANCCG